MTIDSTDVAIDRGDLFLCPPCAARVPSSDDIGICQHDIDSWPVEATCDVCQTRIPVRDWARAVYCRTDYWRSRITGTALADLAAVQASQDQTAWATYSAMHTSGVVGEATVDDDSEALFADLALQFDEDEDGS